MIWLAGRKVSRGRFLGVVLGWSPAAPSLKFREGEKGALRRRGGEGYL